MLGLRLTDMGSVSSVYGSSGFRIRLLEISLLITYVQYHMSRLLRANCIHIHRIKARPRHRQLHMN